MQFKEGTGWKACYDEQRELYTAEEGGGMAYDLFEITKDIYVTAVKVEDSLHIFVNKKILP